MSERRFVIKEIDSDPRNYNGQEFMEWQNGITEDELKRRCEIVASILSGHSPGVRGWNEARDVLIYGEKDSSPA